MITRLAIAGYRSFRDVRIALARLSIVTGANGSGKSSLYRSLRLLADVAQGRIIQSLAAEGGLPSTLWAGPATIAREVRQGVHPIQGLARQTPVSLKLGFASADYGYAIDLGLPAPLELPSKFEFDPII
jgi:predicted ATPase